MIPFYDYLPTRTHKLKGLFLLKKTVLNADFKNIIRLIRKKSLPNQKTKKNIICFFYISLTKRNLSLKVIFKSTAKVSNLIKRESKYCIHTYIEYIKKSTSTLNSLAMYKRLKTCVLRKGIFGYASIPISYLTFV